MKKFVSVLALGALALAGCKEASHEDQRGLVTALNGDQGVTISVAGDAGTAYTISEGVVMPVDLAVNDSVTFKAEGTVISALDKIRIPGNPGQQMVDSTAVGMDSAGAAMGRMGDSLAAAGDSAKAATGRALENAGQNMQDSAAVGQ